ncbi:unnamed protein product [Allacma fusca]|uniref:Gustatory receptor n=1 Tax=Allacma fusca TaxID=39272 RepID=A0A8J2L676_9HEXA|nr:unnamed protein product [Allacma fusca]
MTTKFGNKFESKISVPEKLQELAKPVFQCLRAIGYLSLTIQPDCTVTGGWKSKASFWTLLTILLSLVTTSVVAGTTQKYQTIAKLTPTEKFVHNLLYTIFAVSGLTFQCMSLYKSKSSEMFWKFHNYQFELYTSLGEQFNFCLKNFKYAEKFSDIQKYTRRWVLIALVSSVAFILFGTVFSFYSIFYNISDPWDISGYEKNQEQGKGLNDQTASSPFIKISFIVAIVVWLFRIYLHSALVIYITLFLKLYCACLEVVAQELDEIQRKKFSNKEHSGTVTFKKFQLQPSVTICQEKDGYRSQKNSEETVGSCLECIDIIANLIDGFNDHFGFELLIQIVYCITLVLAYSFFTLFSIIKADHNNIVYCFNLSALLASQIYQLLTECGKIKTTVNQVLTSLCRLDLVKLPEDLQKNVGGILRVGTYLEYN